MKHWIVALLLAGCAAEPTNNPGTAGSYAGSVATLSDGQTCPPGGQKAVSQPGTNPSVEACYALVDGGAWVLHGPRIAWHKTGVLAARQAYRFGQLHGTQQTWAPNGTATLHACYVAGSKAHDGDCSASELTP